MELNFLLGGGGGMHLMFMCVLQCFAASTVLVLKFLVNFMEGVNSVRFTGAISIYRLAETGSAPSVVKPLWQSLEEGCQEARLGVWVGGQMLC